jgi:hypothetical protein
MTQIESFNRIYRFCVSPACHKSPKTSIKLWISAALLNISEIDGCQNCIAMRVRRMPENPSDSPKMRSA